MREIKPKKSYFREEYQNVTVKETKEILHELAEGKKWSLGRAADFLILLGYAALRGEVQP